MENNEKSQQNPVSGVCSTHLLQVQYNNFLTRVFSFVVIVLIGQ